MITVTLAVVRFSSAASRDEGPVLVRLRVTEAGADTLHFSAQPKPFWTVELFVSSMSPVTTHQHCDALLKPPNASTKKCLR
jgi:hypothetical protein